MPPDLHAQLDQTLASPPEKTSFNTLNIDTFNVPRHLGEVRYFHKGTSDRLIVHIQDAHCNEFAQQKIASIIDYLCNEYGIKVINMEGAVGAYDLSVFTSISGKEIRREVADYFVKKGELNGAEYYAINNPNSVRLWGVEDKDLYLANLKVYKKSLIWKKEVDKLLVGLSHQLNNLKRHIYSEELLKIDMEYNAYKSGNIEFKDYFKLITNQARKEGFDMDIHPNLKILSEVMAQEGRVDFEKANDQRDELVDELKKSLSKNNIKELVSKSIDFKTKKLSQKEFYLYLAKMAALSNIKMDKYTELSGYISYVGLFDSVKRLGIMEEIAQLEDQIREPLYQNDTQRELNALSRNLAIMKNMFNISLTKTDYKYYRDNKDSFRIENFKRFIEKEAPLYRINITINGSIYALDKYRDEIARFFDYSFKRDEAFLRNLQFGGDKTKNAMLMTGGFHTENLCKLFENNDISYVSILPKFKNTEDYENPYLKLLAGERTGVQYMLRTVLARKSLIQIASMLSPILAEAANGEEAVQAFKAAVIVLTMLVERQPGVTKKGVKSMRVSDNGDDLLVELEDGEIIPLSIVSLAEKKVYLKGGSLKPEAPEISVLDPRVMIQGTKLWDEFTRRNNGKEPVIVIGTLEEVREKLASLRDSGMDENELVCVNMIDKKEDQGYTYHALFIATLRDASSDQPYKSYRKNNGFVLFQFPFIQALYVDDSRNHIHLQNLSLGSIREEDKYYEGDYSDVPDPMGLRGRGLTSGFSARLRRRLEEKYMNWTVTGNVVSYMTQLLLKRDYGIDWRAGQVEEDYQTVLRYEPTIGQGNSIAYRSGRIGAGLRQEAADVGGDDTVRLMGKLYDSEKKIVQDLVAEYIPAEKIIKVYRQSRQEIYDQKGDSLGTEINIPAPEERVAQSKINLSSYHSARFGPYWGAIDPIIYKLNRSDVQPFQENEYDILGISGSGDTIYLTSALAYHNIAAFHEVGEYILAQDEYRQLVPDGVSIHNFLRGCGEKVREALYEIEPEELEGLSVQEFIDRINREMSERNLRPATNNEITSSEEALIRNNAEQGLHYFMLLYGLEDIVFGEPRTRAFTRIIKVRELFNPKTSEERKNQIAENLKRRLELGDPDARETIRVLAEYRWGPAFDILESVASGNSRGKVEAIVKLSQLSLGINVLSQRGDGANTATSILERISPKAISDVASRAGLETKDEQNALTAVLFALRSASPKASSEAERALNGITEQLKTKARTGDLQAFRTLVYLAVRNIRSAFEVLLDLADENNLTAIIALERIAIGGDDFQQEALSKLQGFEKQGSSNAKEEVERFFQSIPWKIHHLANQSLDGPVTNYIQWLNDIIGISDRVLTDGELALIADDLGINLLREQILVEEAQKVAPFVGSFFESLPADGKHNIYILRDATGLYFADAVSGGSPLAAYFSKISTDGYTRGPGALDKIVIRISGRIKADMGFGSEDIVPSEKFPEFKKKLINVLEDLLGDGQVEYIEDEDILLARDGMRDAYQDFMKYLKAIGIGDLQLMEDGVRFIDSKRTGNFVLLMEAFTSKYLKDNMKMTESQVRGKVDGRMYFSKYYPAISFSRSEGEAAAIEINRIAWPVDYYRGTSSIGADGVPIINEVVPSIGKKVDFLYFALVLRNILLEREQEKKKKREQGKEEASLEERIEARQAADVGAYGDVNRRNDVVRVVVGIIPGTSEAKIRTLTSAINNGLQENGYGDRNDDNQIIVYYIDKDDAARTKQNQDIAINNAEKDLLEGGRIVVFSSQMDDGPQIAEQTMADIEKAEKRYISVVPDAYTDCRPEENKYTDFMARGALARHISYFLNGGDLNTAVRAINRLLNQVSEGPGIASVNDLFNVLRPLRISPINYENIGHWIRIQKAIATSV